LTRSVEDAALMLSRLEGGEPVDLAGATLAGVRLLVLEIGVDGARAQPAKAFAAGVEALAKAGAKIHRARSAEVTAAFDLAGILFASEAYGTWKDAIEAAPQKMYPPVLERFRGGKAFGAADYVAAWQRLDALRAAYLEATAGYDAVIAPTVPNLPPETAKLLADQEYFTVENLLALRNTRIGNLMGLAGLTLPTEVPHCGMMFLGPPKSEERLLRLGAAAEGVLR
jgi:aspartyl-tRNA(Asn)/glutamyl-tRNA(Gln) amidotransferase subunit A